MIYGYARVSTAEQTVALQVDALKAAGCEEIFSDEGVSGIMYHRPALHALMKRLQPGDKLVIWKLDRLGRSVVHLHTMIDDLRRRNIEFCSLREKIDTSSAIGKLLFHILASVAEFERDMLIERTKAGMAAAGRRGIHLGRPKRVSDEAIAKAYRAVRRGRPPGEVARELKLNRSTLWKRFQQLKDSEWGKRHDTEDERRDPGPAGIPLSEIASAHPVDLSGVCIDLDARERRV